MIPFSYTNLDNCVLFSASWPSVEMGRCVQMWAPSRTSDLSELIFLAAANFTLTHQKRRSYQPCLQPPFSQCLPFFLAFLEHLSPYLPKYIYQWFQTNSFCDRGKHFRSLKGNLRHEEMKSCGKSTAEPEKEPNAPIINTFSLITRLLHQISAALCLVLKSLFTELIINVQLEKEHSQFSWA